MSNEQELYRIGGVSHLLDKRVIQFIEKLKAKNKEIDVENFRFHKRIISLDQQVINVTAALNTTKIDFAKAEATIAGLKADFVSFDEFHPRAMKLLRKRKNFLVVAQDEPYFYNVYCQIRDNEKNIDRWTDEDEIKFREIGKEFIKRPIIDDPLEKTK